MFSDTVAFLFLRFSRLLSFPSSSGMVLSKLDTGVGEEPGVLKVSEEGRWEAWAVLRHASQRWGSWEQRSQNDPLNPAALMGACEHALAHAVSCRKVTGDTDAAGREKKYRDRT